MHKPSTRLPPLNKQTPRITLYTSGRCGYCRQAKAFLQKHKIPFAEFNIERNQRAFVEFQRAGGRGVPLITIGKKSVNGFQPDTLKKALKDAGFHV
jgi:glutaredoxin